MEYVPPLGGSPGDPYVNGDPQAGTKGSIVPAGAVEYPQREINHLIAFAGLTPDNQDLTQLRQTVGVVVSTIGALRGIDPTGTATLVLLGHQSIGDGGGGFFYWDAASSDADDNGLTVLPTGHSGNGRWKRVVPDYITPQMLGAAGDGLTDDTTAVQAAIDLRKPVLLIGAYKITSTLTIPTNWDGALVGTHAKDSQLILVGAITGIDISHTNDTAGAVIRDIRITGDNTAGQIGIDGYYLTQNTVLENIWIDDCDIGLRIEKVFYAKFANIRIRNCTTVQLKINADTSSEQVNVTTFNACSFSGGVNCVDARPVNQCYALTFFGCAFENSEKTAFLGENLSGLSLIGCYFENNYSDARDSGPDTLGATDAIDIKLTANSIQRPARVTGCHFSHASGWNASSDKASVYFGERVLASIDGNDYISPAFGTIDYWFRWHADAPAPVIGANQGTSRPSTVYATPNVPVLQNDGTPDLTTQLPANVYRTGGTTTITDIHGGYEGLVITIIAEHSLTITDGTNIFLNGSADFNMVAGDTLTLMWRNGLKYEVSRSVN